VVGPLALAAAAGAAAGLAVAAVGGGFLTVSNLTLRDELLGVLAIAGVVGALVAGTTGYSTLAHGPCEDQGALGASKALVEA
jgi:hypothetical protein